jgi:hypothetical protein
MKVQNRANFIPIKQIRRTPMPLFDKAIPNVPFQFLNLPDPAIFKAS